MVIEADSWDGVGGMGVVGCKRFSLEAETQEEAMELMKFVAEFRLNYMLTHKITSGTVEYADGTTKTY